MTMAYPQPDSSAQEHSRELTRHIGAAIAAAGGWLPFSRFMELALYAPGLGYYTGGSVKFGASGDFITAPEISPLFARTVATQIEQIMRASQPAVFEAGAGSGALAAELLIELERRGCAPERYAILDLSGELISRQRETLAQRAPHLLARVEWLSRLPETWDGAVIGNELLDALPVELLEWRDEGIFQRGVVGDATGNFAWGARPAQGFLLEAAEAIAVTPPFRSEIGVAGSAWVAEWGRRLGQGALLLFDYGFPCREFYHPQRASGTLMCHYRHHAHDDPFCWPGLTDITAHVDFTAVAEAGFSAGLDVLGYTSQAAFLFNCGLTENLARSDVADSRSYLPQARAVDKLINPAEMGELFKVIALGRGITESLLGFSRGDRTHTL
jgi:SAM-dependent MidA family methyltransferase